MFNEIISPQLDMSTTSAKIQNPVRNGSPEENGKLDGLDVKLAVHAGGDVDFNLYLTQDQT